jgi:hypothetical protein
VNRWDPSGLDWVWVDPPGEWQWDGTWNGEEGVSRQDERVPDLARLHPSILNFYRPDQVGSDRLGSDFYEEIGSLIDLSQRQRSGPGAFMFRGSFFSPQGLLAEGVPEGHVRLLQRQTHSPEFGQGAIERRLGFSPDDLQFITLPGVEVGGGAIRAPVQVAFTAAGGEIGIIGRFPWALMADTGEGRQLMFAGEQYFNDVGKFQEYRRGAGIIAITGILIKDVAPVLAAAGTTAPIAMTDDLALRLGVRSPAFAPRFAAQVARTGAQSRLVPGGGLAAHEASGGHTLARHVGLSDEQLAARLATQQRVPAASTFASRSVAEGAIGQALTSRATAVEQWLAGSNARLAFDAPLSSTVGRTLVRGAQSPVSSSTVRVVLVRDAAFQSGYRILTAFPVVP